jgi:hypothetical protein
MKEAIYNVGDVVAKKNSYVKYFGLFHFFTTGGA